jgi:uncharacterized cupredoxin-like copper-binding protein
MGLTGSRRAAAIGAVAFIVFVAAYAALSVLRTDDAHGTAPSVLGPGDATVTINIRRSHFSVKTIRVRQDTLVTFVVRNHDPIAHELIVGPPDVQYRHEHGTDPLHGPKPGEVSIPPDSVGRTIYHFHEVGSVEFACHLPGHYAYGMHGNVIVEPATRNA